MSKHRCFELIKSSLDKGNKFLILNGDGIDDNLFYDFYYGVRTSSDNYKLIFLRQLGYKYFINIDDSGNPSVFDLNNDDDCFKCITDDYFSVRTEDYKPKSGDALGDIPMDSKRQSDASKDLQSQVDEGTPQFRRNKINEKLKKDSSKVVIYFEHFDFYAKLYTQDSEEQVKGIQYINKLLKHINCTVMISIKNAEKLKAFDIKIDGSNMIYIGNPSAQEVKDTYLRMLLRSIPGDINLNLQTLRNIEEVAQAIATSNKSLTQAITIFKSIVIDQGKYDINKHEFEIALENIVPEKVTLDDVVMSPSVRNQIITAVDSFLKSDTLMGRKGIILTGPSGTGKTHIVKAIANEKNCYFLAPTLADLKGEYIGQSSVKVRNIFSQARANSPTIIFLDEADTIFPERDGSADEKDSFTRDMVNQFLVEVDGLTSAKQKIFIIAATNRVNVIDRAIKSRLTQIVEIPLPDKNMRIELFEKRLIKDNIRFREKSYSDMIADRTEGMSGRDIDNFVKRLHELANGKKLSRMADNEIIDLFDIVFGQKLDSLVKELGRDGVEIYPPENNRQNYSDIIGYEQEKQKIDIQLKNISASLEERERCENFKISLRKGILLYGPPGNGKTELVKAVAGEHGFYLIKVLSKNFSSSLPQIQLEQIQNVFEKAFKLSDMLAHVNIGIILFFDEFDALANVNTLSSIVRGTLLDYMTNEKLRSNNSRLFFMAATNFYNVLDEALTRKGRIDTHIFLDNPSKEDGIRILKKKIKDDKSINQERVNDDMIQKGYDRLCVKVRENYVESNCNKIDIYNILHANEVKEYFTEQSKKIMPSIADIINYYEEMKVHSFYRQNNDKLIDIEFK